MIFFKIHHNFATKSLKKMNKTCNTEANRIEKSASFVFFEFLLLSFSVFSPLLQFSVIRNFLGVFSMYFDYLAQILGIPHSQIKQLRVTSKKTNPINLQIWRKASANQLFKQIFSFIW